MEETTQAISPFKERRWTQLHEAATFGDVDLINRLILDGMNVNSKTPMKETPLHSAMGTGMNQSISALLHQGANPNILCGPNQMTPLTLAISVGKSNAVKTLLDTCKELKDSNDPKAIPLDINLENYFGETALHWAATHNRLGMTPLLIEHGSELNKHGRSPSPLKMAKTNGHTEMVQLLKSHGAKSFSAEVIQKPPLTAPSCVTGGWVPLQTSVEEEARFGGTLRFNHAEVFYLGKNPKTLMGVRLYISTNTQRGFGGMQGIISYVSLDKKSFKATFLVGVDHEEELRELKGEWEGSFSFFSSLNNPWILNELVTLPTGSKSIEQLLGELNQQIEQRGRRVPLVKSRNKCWVPKGLEGSHNHSDPNDNDHEVDVILDANYNTDDSTLEILFEDGSKKTVEGGNADQLFGKLLKQFFELQKSGSDGFTLRLDGVPCNLDFLPASSAEGAHSA